MIVLFPLFRKGRGNDRWRIAAYQGHRTVSTATGMDINRLEQLQRNPDIGNSFSLLIRLFLSLSLSLPRWDEPSGVVHGNSGPDLGLRAED